MHRNEIRNRNIEEYDIDHIDFECKGLVTNAKVHSSHIGIPINRSLYEQINANPSREDFILKILDEFLSLEPFGMCSSYKCIVGALSQNESINSIEEREIKAYIAKSIFLTIANDYDGINHSAVEKIRNDYTTIFRTNIDRDYLFISIIRDISNSTGISNTSFKAKKACFDFDTIEFYSGYYKVDIVNNTIKLVKDVVVPF